MDPLHYKGEDITDLRYLYSDVVLYHKDCPDGIGSAWAIYHDNKINNRKIEYHGVEYNKKLNINITNKNVIIVDFSYNLKDLGEICKEASYVTILDHHKTAYKELNSIITNSKLQKSFTNLEFYIDMNRSGAQITWDTMFKNDRPYFIDYIGDRDLWKFELPHSKEFNTALFHTGLLTFEGLDKLYENNLSKTLIKQGKVILSVHNNIIDRVAESSVLVLFNNYRVRVPTITFDMNLRSDVGHRLCQFDDCDFSATWEYLFTEKKWKISLRSLNECNIELDKIANKYGGGGHMNASGFKYDGKIYHLFRIIE